jgi:DNA-binding CsgD family transcriptional regulator/PAS domain-containing protein
LTQRAVKLEDLLDILYLASTDPAMWPQFLVRVATFFDAHVAAILAQNTPDRFLVSSLMGLDGKVIAAYDEYYSILDPWLLGMREGGLSNWIGSGSALCPPSKLNETEFYRDFWRHAAPPSYQGGIMLPGLVFTLHRDQTRGDFTEDVHLLHELSPHLRRALGIHSKVTDLRHSLAQLGGVIDALDVGLIGLTASRTLSFANPAAEKLLRVGDVLALRDGRLITRDSAATAALDNLIEIALNRKLSAPPGGAITVTGASGSLHLTVIPTPGPAGVVPGGSKLLITITDPAAAPKTREHLLAALFRLTPAETRVTMLLLSGLEPSQIADQTRTTAGTVRFQLKAIFRKTGVRRQSELMRLVSRLPGK